MNKLTLATDGDTDIVAVRRFEAPPEAVYRAHTEAALIRQWMLGPLGWHMPVCSIEAKPGGQLHYEWQSEEGERFAITGEVHDAEPGARLVHTERMQLVERTVEYRVETLFEADGEGTKLTMRMTMPDEKTRQMMMESGMDQGLEASYARVAPLLSGVIA